MNWTRDLGSVDSWVNTSIYGELNTIAQGIDLRQEMSWILHGAPGRNSKGHWIAYRRFDTCSLSENWNSQTKEGIGGPANPYVDIALKTRRVPLKFGGDILKELKAGQLLENKYTYYLEWDIMPKRNDVIFELNIPGPMPATINLSDYTYIEKFVIKNIHPYRLEQGRIEYWMVSVEYDEIGY